MIAFSLWILKADMQHVDEFKTSFLLPEIHRQKTQPGFVTACLAPVLLTWIKAIDGEKKPLPPADRIPFTLHWLNADIRNETKYNIEHYIGSIQPITQHYALSLFELNETWEKAQRGEKKEEPQAFELLDELQQTIRRKIAANEI